MSWRSMITVFLLLGALASGWALWSQRNKDHGGPKAGGRSDYVLNDFEVVVLDKQGKESFTLRAPKLTRDPNIKTMDIATPTFLIPPAAGAGGGAWEVKSKSAWVSAKADEVRLRGQVQADSTNAGGKPISIATEELNVFPDTNKATSAVPVKVVQPGTIMTGSGLQADLETKNVNIPNVKVRYEAKAR
ncbi:LPS export ABC transporter periplasmic protein LptC [Lysobacter sp. 5GHs7-4]|uniref:LPS export ABC transporter periplasmic protein LptC n=1 Tax=Lysobacter sp. 5GHs7-4 TaxID=2904253 RepID=UPI0017F2FC66|nr:LPS export ABC transporter periplasmic protein LptC [Lysobacter sp. 5GHs7-4]NUO78188.1 LPS export ABC transporter periplasmic protein LptC [Lysobacter sp.]UHQ22342.1 LPS export ABC transporter periplasmic protein LptC [Lysobacter sp. 5GHs7-4]